LFLTLFYIYKKIFLFNLGFKGVLLEDDKVLGVRKYKVESAVFVRHTLVVLGSCLVGRAFEAGGACLPDRPKPTIELFA